MMASSRSFLVVGALACAGALASGVCSSGSPTPNPTTGCHHPPEITSCSPGAGTLPTPANESSPCSVEGARCSGTLCFDFGDMPFETTCCAGAWRPNYTGDCPAPVQPGDLFVCSGTLSCAAGQTYCSLSTEGSGHDPQSCQPICAAGDCTCFCDKAEGCDFKPPGSTCPADICHCRAVTVGPNIPVPGAVTVQCDYVLPNSDLCFRDPSVDARCGGLSHAVFCVGGTSGLGVGCTPLSDSGSSASCGTDVEYYCCNN